MRNLCLAFICAIGLLYQPALMHAQQEPASTGQIVGTVSDASGALVRAAEVTVTNIASGAHSSAKTGLRGQFVFRDLTPGVWRITIRAAGFLPALRPSVTVTAGHLATAEVVLHIAPVTAEVKVEGAEPGQAVTQLQREQGSGTSDLLRNIPGVSLRGDATFASTPLLHGMGDERTKILVNGMSVSPSCPNHMNPPLSYMPTADASSISVIAGLTPVSQGGDSLGGTISIDSAPPVFAAPDEHLAQHISVSPFYRSNGTGYGGSLSAGLANHTFAIDYSGSFATNDDNTDGAGNKITSTYARRIDNSLTLAVHRGPSLFVLTAGIHSIPFQGFVNARMDMLDNHATQLNFHYWRTLHRGSLDARIYYQNAAHTMNLGHDKATFPMAMFMPMHSHGTDSGYTIRYEIPFSPIHTLRVGNELHRFVLNDVWPPVAGQEPMMGPDSFIDINDGHRTRLGTFAEVASQWNHKWSSLLGLRNDAVWSTTGTVHGYSMMYAADAAVFNAAHRSRTDVDMDATALVRYRPGNSAAFEIGYARKSRAPNLYERYAWSTDPMISSMIGWFGDGNDYVGNLNLRPEVAHTISGTLSAHTGVVQFTATPYATWIHDYIDVNRLELIMSGMSTIAQLQFANHPARIAGADFSGSARIWNSAELGRGTLTGLAGWLQGERTDSHTGLYEIMPVHARFAVDQDYTHWQSGIAIQLVDRKSSVDPFRLEQQTPGYALVDIHTAYHRGPLNLSATATNLLNRQYLLPLGGVNMDKYLASMSMGPIEPISGIGRSVNTTLTLRF